MNQGLGRLFKLGKSSLRLVLLAGLLFVRLPAPAQPGTWQTHFSYRSAQSVAVLGQQVYAATRNGFFRYDKERDETRLITRADGLSEVVISRVLALPDQGRILLAYRSGTLDFLSVNAAGEPGAVQTIRTIATSERVPAAFRGINHLNRVGNLVYLSTDFGLVVFDLSRSEIRDTYFSPPNSGLPAAVLMTAVLGDSLYALTRPSPFFPAATLVQSVRLSPTINLADPANWRLSQLPGGNVNTLASNQTQLLAATKSPLDLSGGIYARSAPGSWSLIQSSRGPTGVFQTAGGVATLVSGSTAAPVLTVPGIGSVSSPLLQFPREVVTDSSRFWLADTSSGLLEARTVAGNPAGTLRRIAPEGPFFDTFPRLFAFPDRLVALPGNQQTNETLPAGQPEAELFELPTAHWRSESITSLNQAFNSAAYLPPALFLGSYGGGLWQQTDNDSPQRVALPTTISPLLTTLATDNQGNLWLATGAGGQTALHVRRPGGQFESFPRLGALPIAQIVPDDFGTLWLRLSYGLLLAFKPETGQQRYFSTAAGDGNLPGNNVTALVRDRNGLIWVGTDRGVTVFDDPERVFTGSVSANAPLFDRRRLLATETITAMAVDGGNRKWLATEAALYRFGPDGTTLESRFTPADSPLPALPINDLAVEPRSGRVFMATAGGLVSYGGIATEPAGALEGITLFPNPVRPDYSGLVGIRGLTADAVVKVLDAAGQLVFETRAQGGTATWNLHDYRGRPAQSGIYLVVVVNSTGEQGLAGKLAVIR